MKKENNDYFIRKLMGFSIGPVLSAGIGFLTTLVMTWFIDPDGIGKVSIYSVTLTLIFILISLGLDRSYIREYNSFYDKKKLLSNCFLIPFVNSILVLVLILIFQNQISFLLFQDSERLTIIILALSVPFKIISNFNYLLIRVREDSKKYSFLMVFERVLNLLFLIILFKSYSSNYKVIIMCNFLSLSFTSVVGLVINKFHFRLYFNLEKKILKNLLNYGLPYMPSILFMWVLNSMDKISLRMWSNFKEIGLYAVAFNVVMGLKIVQSSFSSFWTPVSYRWYEEKVEYSRFINISKKLTVILTVISGMIILSKDYIIFIFDKSYKNSAMMIPFLIFIITMETISYTTGCGINFKRKTIYNLGITFSTGIFNLLGNYLLVPKFGGIGASVSTGFSFILFFWMKTLISRKIWYKFNLRFYIINIFLLIVLALISVWQGNKFIEISIFWIIVIYNKNQIKEILYYSFNLIKHLGRTI